MKKSVYSQRVWFYILLTFFSLMVLYTCIEVFVLFSDGGTNHPIHAAISFAHLFFWLPVTVFAIALLLTNYNHLQKKCHSVKTHHKYQKVLKRYLLLYAAEIALSMIALFGAAYIPVASPIMVVAAYAILVVTTALLLRHSVRLKDYME